MRISTLAFFLLSSSANFSASSIFCLISSSESEVWLSILIDCSVPVPKSLAETLTIPFASISNVTSICGIPLGAAGIPIRWNRPKVMLSLANSLSPCNTCTSTAGWLSAAVEKVSDLREGMVVFLSIIVVVTPPRVSIPRVRGVTSRSNTSVTPSSPTMIPACRAAPMATASSGFIPLNGALPTSFSIAC